MLVRVYRMTASSVTVHHNGLQLLICRSLLTTTLTFDAMESQKQKAIKQEYTNFDVLLTVHLSILFLVINQHDAQNLFYNKFIFILPLCAHIYIL